MRRFVEGANRGQSTLFPECLKNWIGGDNPVRVIDVFAGEFDLAELGFSGVDPEVTGRPSYQPSTGLKLYIYGYLNRVQSSRRLEREAGRNSADRRGLVRRTRLTRASRPGGAVKRSAEIPNVSAPQASTALPCECRANRTGCLEKWRARRDSNS